MAVAEKEVREVLKKIFDPEIHISIMDLGLIYGVDINPVDAEKAKVNIRMTMTTPACPYGPALLSKVYADVSEIPGVSDVNVDLVWSPPWDPRKMASEEAKMQMGIFDMEDEDEDAGGEEGAENSLKSTSREKSK
jgi:metal-sulfur cluster biosynthetic enzyme